MANLSMTSVELDVTMRERVQQIADIRHQSVDHVMRDAIESYVVREEKKTLSRRDAVAEWEHYLATGLHVTADEADEWLAKLESGEEATIPECHR